MLCSDALAVSRSSVHFLTFPHTRATTFFVPDSCGPGRYMRRSYAGSGPPIKKTPDNATLLLIEKPWAEVGERELVQHVQRVEHGRRLWRRRDV